MSEAKSDKMEDDKMEDDGYEFEDTCPDNNCERVSCHRCFPRKGCELHEKCRDFTKMEEAYTEEEILAFAKQ